MTIERKTDAPKAKFDPFEATIGGYRANGSWDEEGRPGTPLYNLVKELRRIRRSTNETPAQLVQRIPTPLLPAFPNAHRWATLTDRPPYMPAGQWCAAHCSTSVESSVVYAFKDSTGYPRDAAPGDSDLHQFPVSEVVQSVVDEW
jgi:hypothetical protein